MIGKTISHYEILAKLGEGGMGVVYKAWDTKLDRTVAVKFLPRELMVDPDARVRLTREAKAASVLDHPNICTVHEIDEIEGTSFIVMGYVEGQNLSEKTATQPLALEQALDIAIQVGEGLAEAHEKGVVHRDIKSSNIMVTPKGQAKITDFGLATGTEVKALADAATTGGTLAYMSPEQARGDAVDHRTDIWSLGVVLYEMVAGHLPFKGDYREAILYSILNESPLPVSAVRSDVPGELERIISKTLAKPAEERYQHVDELISDLKGIKEGQGKQKKVESPPAPRFRWWKSVYLYIGLLALLALILVVRPSFLFQREERIDSIAVLPLQNLSGDAEQEYFAEGMTEALITELSKVEALRVISRRSVMRFKGTTKPVSEIARELGVEGIVEGSALLVGGQVRITVQLIGAAKDENLWADAYEGDLSDILTLQKEVARAIAEEIQIALTPEEEARLAGAPRVDPEAHKAYLKGLFSLNILAEQPTRTAIEYFERAIEIDPDYSLPYVGLARAYNNLAALGWVSPREGWPVAHREALRALGMDSTDADAHALLADVMFVYDWDWEGAEREFRRAIELDPGSAMAHNWYAMFLAAVGRFEEAEREIRKAVELDPLTAPSNASWIFMLARRPDKAIEQARVLQQTESGLAMASVLLGNVYLNESRYEEAISELEKATALYRDSLLTASALARAYALSGNTDKAARFLVYCVQLSQLEYFPSDEIAAVYAALGDNDRAFTWLERALRERSSDLIWLKVHPRYDPLRRDSRFQGFLERMGWGE